MNRVGFPLFLVETSHKAVASQAAIRLQCVACVSIEALDRCSEAQAVQALGELPDDWL